MPLQPPFTHFIRPSKESLQLALLPEPPESLDLSLLSPVSRLHLRRGKQSYDVLLAPKIQWCITTPSKTCTPDPRQNLRG